MRNAQDVLSVVLVERDEAASIVELGKQAPDLLLRGGSVAAGGHPVFTAPVALGRALGLPIARPAQPAG
jgi:hypothetical protein